MSYIYYLNTINKSFCKESEIRDTTNFQIIIDAIHEALCSEEKNILINSMKVAALIKLFQPFQEGNHRTGLIVFGDLITQNGYTFNYENALADMKNHSLNIPTIYTENDKITNIENWYKYIEKQTILKK